MHFKLYEGDVEETNRLTEVIADILREQEEIPAYSELKRRLGFEYNGMVLHEYYFDNLKKDGGGDPARNSAFLQARLEFHSHILHNHVLYSPNDWRRFFAHGSPLRA